VIIDKFNVLREGTSVGFDPDQDRRAGAWHLAGEGIVVIPKAQRTVKGSCSP
jgi:ADP-glucose pyrophosphorylase